VQIQLVPDFPSFKLTAQIGGNLGSGAERLGVYEFDKLYNGAAAYKNGNFFVFYGGDTSGWQWVGDYNQWAGNGPALSSVPTAQDFMKYMQFQLETDEVPDFPSRKRICPREMSAMTIFRKKGTTRRRQERCCLRQTLKNATKLEKNGRSSDPVWGERKPSSKLIMSKED
jgi:hypothetical protein